MYFFLRFFKITAPQRRVYFLQFLLGLIELFLKMSDLGYALFVDNLNRTSITSDSASSFMSLNVLAL